MAASKILTDGIWSWYCTGPVYVSADNAFYFQWIDHLGSVRTGKYSSSYGLVQQTTQHTALEVDDHDCGAVLPLANQKLLSCYGPHAVASNHSRLSSSASDIRAFAAEQTIDGTGSDTFSVLWQSADTAATIWHFIQRTASPYALGYFTSTDGSTWSSYVDLWHSNAGSTNISLMRTAPNGANRLDFFTSDGHPLHATCSLYHFYMTVASNGTASFFNSAGTSLGSPPFTSATANMTKVYDGSVTCSMVWDLQIIGGQPVGAFAIYPNAASALITSTTSRQIQYYQAVFNGSTWSTGLVAEAGTAWNSAARQDWLYAAECDYAGGICLDPNDVNTVYISKTYGGTNGVGATDCRLEQWTNASGWSKTADISGSTGTLNCRPFVVRGMSPTQILYWNAATYTSYTSWSTSNVWSYPGLTTYATKIASPTWVAANGPIGEQAYFLLAEGSGTSTKELVSGASCPFIGSPTWSTDAYGATLGGFSSSIAVNADGTAGALAAAANSTTGYPRYLWALWSNTNTTTAQYLLCFGNSTSTQDLWGLVLNNTASGQVGGVLRDHSGTILGAVTGISNTAATDGNPHVLCLVSSSASSHTLYLDGLSIGTVGTTVASYTFQNLTLGSIRRNGTQSSPFLGSLIAAGWGLGAPDQVALYRDLIDGQFGGTRSAVATGAALLRRLITGGD